MQRRSKERGKKALNKSVSSKIRYLSKPGKTALTAILLATALSLTATATAYQPPGSGTASDQYEINLTDLNKTTLKFPKGEDI